MNELHNQNHIFTSISLLGKNRNKKLPENVDEEEYDSKSDDKDTNESEDVVVLCALKSVQTDDALAMFDVFFCLLVDVI